MTQVWFGCRELYYRLSHLPCITCSISDTSNVVYNRYYWCTYCNKLVIEMLVYNKKQILKLISCLLFEDISNRYGLCDSPFYLC